MNLSKIFEFLGVLQIVLRSALLQEDLIFYFKKLIVSVLFTLIEYQSVLLLFANKAFTLSIFVVRYFPLLIIIIFEESLADIFVLPRVLIENELR